MKEPNAKKTISALLIRVSTWKQNLYPNAPCMEYLPTLGEKLPHSMGEMAGKYSHPMEHLGYNLLHKGISAKLRPINRAKLRLDK